MYITNTGHKFNSKKEVEDHIKLHNNIFKKISIYDDEERILYEKVPSFDPEIRVKLIASRIGNGEEWVIKRKEKESISSCAYITRFHNEPQKEFKNFAELDEYMNGLIFDPNYVWFTNSDEIFDVKYKIPNYLGRFQPSRYASFSNDGDVHGLYFTCDNIKLLFSNNNNEIDKFKYSEELEDKINNIKSLDGYKIFDIKFNKLYSYNNKNERFENYDSDGKLKSIIKLPEQTITLSYTILMRDIDKVPSFKFNKCINEKKVSYNGNLESTLIKFIDAFEREIHNLYNAFNSQNKFVYDIQIWEGEYKKIGYIKANNLYIIDGDKSKLLKTYIIKDEGLFTTAGLFKCNQLIKNKIEKQSSKILYQYLVDREVISDGVDDYLHTDLCEMVHHQMCLENYI